MWPQGAIAADRWAISGETLRSFPEGLLGRGTKTAMSTCSWPIETRPGQGRRDLKMQGIFSRRRSLNVVPRGPCQILPHAQICC